MSEPKVQARSRAIALVAEVGGRQQLVVQIDVECPSCGDFTVLIPGHHLKMVSAFLADCIERYPELTQATVTKTEGTEVTLDRAQANKAHTN